MEIKLLELHYTGPSIEIMEGEAGKTRVKFGEFVEGEALVSGINVDTEDWGDDVPETVIDEICDLIQDEIWSEMEMSGSDLRRNLVTEWSNANTASDPLAVEISFWLK